MRLKKDGVRRVAQRALDVINPTYEILPDERRRIKT
jgi:hypothetical protein